MRGISSKLLPLLIAAAVFLIAAVGGSAIAGSPDAARSRQLTGSKLKNRSVSGRKLKRNTLTGAEVNESRLGVVPLAANASTLGGKPAGDYVPAGKVLTAGSVVKLSAGQTRVLFSKGPLSAEASCVNTGGANRKLDISFKSTEANSVWAFVLSGVAVGPGTPFTETFASDFVLGGTMTNYSFAAPSGTSVQGNVSGAVHQAGVDCVVTLTGIG